MAAALSVAMLASVAVLAALGEPQNEAFLDYSEDNFKVQFISGNLTASVTRDWPRVDFQHSDNLLSPMFEVSMTRAFLYNDTNGDGVFSRSEAQYTALLGSSNVRWNMSAVELGHSEGIAYASVTMWSEVSLWKGYVEQATEAAAVQDWANMTFRFSIYEAPIAYANSFGQYVVAGKTDMHITMSIDILKKIGSSSVALEEMLQAGGSIYLFLVKEKSAVTNETVTNTASARVDERVNGMNYTNAMRQTASPSQDIEFATDEGTVQAYYRFGSEPTIDASGNQSPLGLNCSYYTTGTAFILNPSYAIGNDTTGIVHEKSIGLQMSGFVRVRDWAVQNLPVLAVVTGGIVVLAVLSVHVWRRKRRMLLENGNEIGQGSSGDTGPK